MTDTVKLDASSDLVIDQWAGSPKLRAVIDAVVETLRESAVPALEKIKRMLDIDVAEGIWLDYIGARLGMVRPSASDLAIDRRFGFDDAGTGFDDLPFKGNAENDAVYPLPDALYRKLVKSRAVLVLGDGTCQTFSRAVRMIDPGAAVQDRRNMTIRVVTSMRSLIMLADRCGALPRTAGVEIMYAYRGRFGYDSAGEPFDQGAFS